MPVYDDPRAGEAAAVRLARGEAVQGVLDGDDPRAWLALDAGVRRAAWWCAGAQRAEWERVAPLPDDPAGLDAPRYALALCHRDGRVREAAVRGVAAHPSLLPLLVVRAADWGAPVRQAARQVLRELVDGDAVGEGGPGTVVGLAPVILLVGRRERGAFGVALLDEVLRDPSRAWPPALLSHGDPAVRRHVHRLAVGTGRLSPAELARTAADDADTVVQSVCADAALASVPEGRPCEEVAGPLLAARSPRARSAGVTALRRTGEPERAVAFLADRSAMVRACARYVVRQAGGDPVAWYRERCARAGDPLLPPGAVIGLAECGERADADTLWALLAHPSAAVRARAVAGLRVLDTADVRRLHPLLDDPAPGVVRETVLAVEPSVHLLSDEWLGERLDAGRPRHVRVGALRLAFRRGGSARARALRVAREDPDPVVRARAAREAAR
ncbi:hypothetical protein OG739_11435 [Streptomyces longwoodensis]|uniref:hypothetical protein n=1 Tax=Streptomyces longwoodensis TaxID=68231 RepID=UPI00325032EF